MRDAPRRSEIERSVGGPRPTAKLIDESGLALRRAIWRRCDLRLVDDSGMAFWGRFNEGADDFSLCDENGCRGNYAPVAGAAEEVR